MRFLIVLFLFFFPSLLYSEDSITAPSYLLIEVDPFRIIDGRNYEEPYPPASTIKVLTALIALERLKDDEIIKPGREVCSLPSSKIGLIPGKPYKASDLIKATLIKSANDAAYTLAKYIGGNEKAFADLMTEKARILGAKNTVVKNSTGLYADGQFTTALDLAFIFKEALKNEKFKEIISTKSFSLRQGRKIIYYENHNRFLSCFSSAVGGKTGYTRASKYTYVGAFEKDGHLYILSLLGSEDLWGDAKKILMKVFDDLPSDEELRLAKAKVKVVYLRKDKGGKKYGKKVANKKIIRKRAKIKKRG